MAARPRPRDGDPADAVARVAHQRGPVLLRHNRHRRSEADLEDCLQQATIELITRARSADRAFHHDGHIANALQQRFLSRVADRRRALSGRSPGQRALNDALGNNLGVAQEPVIEQVPDPAPGVEEQAEIRLTLAQMREVIMI